MGMNDDVINFGHGCTAHKWSQLRGMTTKQDGHSVYLSASIPNVLNPEKFVDQDTFIGSEKPVTYLLAGTSINTGVFGTKMKPFISTKLIPDGENQTHMGGTFDFNRKKLLKKY